MSVSVSTSRRLISVTGGNLRNEHLYISGHHDFFPEECYGESSSRKGMGRKLTLMVEGLRETVETDIATNEGSLRPRNFFRKRAWVRRFMKHHHLREGDLIVIERLDRFTYRMYPFEGKAKGEGAAGAVVSEGRKGRHEGTLFPDMNGGSGNKGRVGFGDSAFTNNRNEPIHRWVPWIAGFSASFVREVFDASVPGRQRTLTVLDPFGGVGTTLVEGLKRGYNVVGFEINPYAAMACEVKLSSVRCKLDLLREVVNGVERLARGRSAQKAAPRSKPPGKFRSRTRFFSPGVEREVLMVQDFIAEQKDRFVKKMLKVALGAVMVGFSNYSYEPSLSRRSSAGKGPVEDADVFGVFRDKLLEMEADIRALQQDMKCFGRTPKAQVYQRSYLTDSGMLASGGVDVLVTSPPYLNNYHYVRNTRPQLYWLGLAEGNGDLKKLEEESFGRFWQTVRNGPAVDLSFELGELEDVLASIRRRNSEKGVYGGFGWANYAATYFNDCYRFFEVTRRVMKPGGLVVVVIGNNIVQGVHIETERFLAEIAKLRGFRVEGMHIVRKKRTGSSIVNSTVRAGVTKESTQLNETAVELRVPL